MPTYEYRCNACDNKWDEFQSITSTPTKRCPKCKKVKAERIISAGGGIIFKGSGFYQTDYRSESYNKAKAADKPSDGGGSSGDSKSGPSSGGESKSASESKSSNNSSPSSETKSSGKKKSGGSTDK